MKKWLLALTCVLLTSLSYAQNVYKIRADSVLIYNTCDTAELILENRTQDTLGFLYNKGRGRTEFRRLRLGQIGPSQLSILGQDTIDMNFSAYGDTRYDLLSTNFFTIPIDSIWLVNRWPSKKVIGYRAYNSPDMPPLSNQAKYGVGNRLYYNGLVMLDGSAGFDLAVNWNGELAGPNGVFVRTKDDTQTAWSGWRELLFKDYADTAYALNSAQTLETVVSRGNTSSRDILFAGSGASSPGLSWIYNTDNWRIFVESPQDTPAGDMIFETGDNDQEGWLFRTKTTGGVIKPVLNIQPEGTFTFLGNDILHTGNHAAGSAFSQTLTGANVFSTITTNASGHLTQLTSRALTPADIGAAPASASGNYIQNQTAADQASSGFRITGTGRSNSQFQVVKDGSSSIASAFQLYNAASTRGANIQLDASTNPGLNFWLHDGTIWQNRMLLAANGAVGIGTTNPIGGVHIVNNTTGVTLESTRAYATTSGGLYGAYNRGTPTAANQRLGGLIIGALTNGTELRPSSQIDVLTSAAWTNDSSQPSYMRFMTTAAGAFQPTERMRIAADGAVTINTIPALGTAGTNFLTSNAGVISSRTAAQVLTDIGAAPASASGSYVQNTTAAQASSNFWISGQGVTNGSLQVRKDGSNTINGAFTLYPGSTTTRGWNFQLNADTDPGLSIWGINSTGAWTERQRVNAATGALTIYADNGEGINLARNVNTVGAATGGLNFFALNAASAAVPYAKMWSVIESNTSGAESGSLITYTRNGGSLVERMRVTAAGNVGIGTTSPVSPLHVAGNATAAFFTSTNGTGSTIPHLRMQTSALNRWVIGMQNNESSGNAGSDFMISRYNDAGALIDAPLVLTRSTGVMSLTEAPTVDGSPVWYTANHPAGSAFTPTLTGANVLSTLTTNAAGHITALTTRALTLADIGAAPASASANYIQNQTGSPQSANFNISGTGTIGGGTLLLNNSATNLLSINAIGLGAPTFTSRSAGSKISVWNAAPSATTAGWDIGMETNHMWFGASTNANNVGFKWYGGTTQVGRLDGLGSLQLEGQGRFKGWYTANGSGIAAELGVTNGIATLLGYDRTNVAYSPLQLSGGSGSTAYTFKMDGTGYLFPSIASYGILGTDASGKLIDVAANYTPDARTLTLTAGAGISVTGGTQDLSANRTWTIANSGVTSFNGSTGAVTYAPTLQMVTTNGKITTDTIRVDSLTIGGIFQTSGYAGIRPSAWSNSTYMMMGHPGPNQHTYISAGNAGDVYIRQANNTTTSQLVVPASGSPYIGTSASNLILTSTNHVPGSAFAPTLTGANVLSSLAVNSAGHVTSLATRALTAADISAAPASGSANYIQNQTATAQSASFNISGDASIGGGDLNLTNATANNLGFGNNGIAAPTYNSHSAGTKVSLVSFVSSTNAGYNIGIEDSHIWFNVANYNATLGWKFYGGTTQVGRLGGTGDLEVAGSVQGTSVIQTSLRSLKKDIQPFSASALKVFEKAQVRTFKFKADSTGRTRIGFIADEVPDEMAPAERNGVDQSNTVALLVKAVQELTEQNKALQQEIKEIKEQLKNKEK